MFVDGRFKNKHLWVKQATGLDLPELMQERRPSYAQAACRTGIVRCA